MPTGSLPISSRPAADRATKLGPHVLRTAPGLSEYLQARPAVAKFVGDWGMARGVPEGTLVTGRRATTYYDAQLQRNSGKTPRQAARQFVEDHIGLYRSDPHIRYWEGHNEPVWSSLEEMGWYAEFEIHRLRLMAGYGLKCVVGNFATGTPPLGLWPAFLPACREAIKHEALLGLHEYSCPWMWWMTGEHQLSASENQGDEGWTTLRYRKVYRQFLEPHGLGNLPLVITECGIDPLVNPRPPGTPPGAWRHLGGFWAKHDNEPNAADFYYRQLLWYDNELQKDDYVVGATIFTWGSFGPPWEDFDVAGSEVADKLIAYTQSEPAHPFVYPEAEVGDPPEPRGLPRVGYARTYVLMPPGASAAWAGAVVDACWDLKRYTIGGSADDAGVGDLDIRRVIAVNPHKWPGPLSLDRFFSEHYPGVEYIPVTAATPAELAHKLSAS